MALYGIFSFLDYAVYGMIRYVMRLIILVANANFFNETTIGEVATKVYVVLGVLVLFKIVISCIQYMVNPDTFDDKDKGMAGILKKAAISMALLALVQPIFSFALEVQGTIVSTIPGIVLGDNSEGVKINNNDEGKSFRKSLDDISDKVASTTIWSFVTPKEDRRVSNGTTVEEFRQNITSGCDGNIWALFDTNKCNYEYRVGISTAAGIFLLYVLASMALDVGIRTIKFGILQILAPIPISSYIVSKDKLNKFFKLASKVYLDLFIRLLVIYFIIFFVQKVIDGIGDAGNIIANGAYVPDPLEKSFIKVIIIVALFMFAKNAPKFICDVLGIDGGGFGDLKDMFTRGGGLFGTTAAGLRTARSNYTAQKERALGKNPKGKIAARLKGAMSAAAGFGSATGRGLAMTAQGKGFKDVRKGATSAALAARNRRNERVDKLYNRNSIKDIFKGTRTPRGQYVTDADGNRVERKVLSKIPGIRNFQWAKYQREKNPEYYGYMDYRRDVKREKLGIPSAEGFVKARYDAMEGIAKTAADAKGHGVGKMNETPDRYKVSITGSDSGRTISGALGFTELTMEQVRNMYAMAKNGQQITKADGTTKVSLSDAQITALGTLVQNVEKRTSYLKEAELMGTGDPAASPNVDKLVIGLSTNKDMFSSSDIMSPIIEKMKRDVGSTITLDGKTYDVSKMNYDTLLTITRHLQSPIHEPKSGDKKYADMRAAGKTTAEISAQLAADTNAYFKDVGERANILVGIKDAFEEVAKRQYKPAQVADNRAQKAQQAIKNNNEKNS